MYNNVACMSAGDVMCVGVVMGRVMAMVFVLFVLLRLALVFVRLIQRTFVFSPSLLPARPGAQGPTPNPNPPGPPFSGVSRQFDTPRGPTDLLRSADRSRVESYRWVDEATLHVVCVGCTGGYGVSGCCCAAACSPAALLYLWRGLPCQGPYRAKPAR